MSCHNPGNEPPASAASTPGTRLQAPRMGWAEEGMNRSSHPGGCERVRQRLCRPKNNSPGLAFPGDGVLPCPSPASQRVAVSLPRCRGSLCQLRLCPADRCAHRTSASPSAQLLPGDAGKSRDKGKTEGKAAGKGQSPAGAAGASGEGAPGSAASGSCCIAPASITPAPSAPCDTGKGGKRGFLIPERCRGVLRHHHAAALPPSEPEKAQSQAELPHRIRAQGQPAAPPSPPPAGTAEGTECSHPKHPLWIPGAAHRDLRG